MFDCFLTQLLVLFMQLFCCIRIFFTKNSKIDSATVLAPAALLISIIAFFMWGNVPFAIPLMIFSLVVFLTNVRSLFRLAGHLYVDRYSALFLIFTFAEIFLIVAGAVLLILNRPVNINPEKFNAVKKIERLTGNFSSGFETALPDEFNFKTTGYLYTYSPVPVKSTSSVPAAEAQKPAETETQDEAEQTIPELTQAEPQKPVIIFSGTDTAEVVDYEPYLLFLAQKGYTVLAADFYSPDLTYFEKTYENSRVLRKSISLTKKETSESRKETVRKNIVQSYVALTDLAKIIYGEGKQFFFVTDALDYESIFEITENAGTQALGFYPLSKISEYKTAGFGFVEQTNIALAKKNGLRRDSSLFIPRYAAGKTVEELKALQL